MARFYTNKLLQMIEDGLINKDQVISMCLEWMGEGDVEDMMDFCNLNEDEDALYEGDDDNALDEEF